MRFSIIKARIEISKCTYASVLLNDLEFCELKEAALCGSFVIPLANPFLALKVMEIARSKVRHFSKLGEGYTKDYYYFRSLVVGLINEGELDLTSDEASLFHDALSEKGITLVPETVIVPDDMKTEVISYTLAAMNHYFGLAEKYNECMREATLFVETLSHINEGKPINGLHYADVIIDHFNLK